MKKTIKKWTLRLTATGLLLAGILLAIVLNPILTYANKTRQHNYTVFHNRPLNASLTLRLEQATQLAAASELYNPRLKLDICLNDGSAYPRLMEAIGGRAFARGFYNKVVLFGKADFPHNVVELNGYKWNLSQLLAHEMIHCYQFDKRGFWKSRPVADIDNWKWEGYPEYIARQNNDQKDLIKNIDKLMITEKTTHNGWISFADGTGTLIDYYKSRLLVQYCMEVKNRNYDQVIADTLKEDAVYRDMMRWYREKATSTAD